MKTFFATFGFLGLMWLWLWADDVPMPQPPHVSAITPPPIPFDQPFLRPYPLNAYMIHVPEDKRPGPDGLLSVGNMQMDELLERVRTNKYNLYLLELRPRKASRKVPVTIAPEDLEPEAQHP